MKGSTKGKRSTPEEHSHLTIAVEGFEASVSAAVNHLAYEPQYAWHSLDEEPVYQFRNSLIVSGTLLGPTDRAGDRCVVTLYGYGSPTRDLGAKLEDIAELKQTSPREPNRRSRSGPGVLFIQLATAA
jgi:hypothetical protein